MSRCPLCGRKDCCGGYYQEVQDVLVEALEGAKWLIECYVAKPERYEEYQDVVKAIRKRGVRDDGQGTAVDQCNEIPYKGIRHDGEGRGILGS